MSMQLLTFKTPIGYNNTISPSLNVCVVFDFRNIAIACSLKKFYQNSMAISGLFYFQEKFEKSIVL